MRNKNIYNEKHTHYTDIHSDKYHHTTLQNKIHAHLNKTLVLMLKHTQTYTQRNIPAPRKSPPYYHNC